MADFDLTQSGQEIQDILNGAAMQTDLTNEIERAEQAEQQLQGNIDLEETRAKAAEKQNADAIDVINGKIPVAASSENQLADKNFVNSSIATNTATYRGAYNLVSDLHLTIDATEQQIAAALAVAISTADNNDYCFVQIPTSDVTPTQIGAIERYKFNGTAWAYEYTLNNSGFTADQWAALNSGITTGLVAKLTALPTNDELMLLLGGKQNVLTFDNAPTEGSTNPVKSSGVYAAIAEEAGTRAAAIAAIVALIPSAASALNQLADKAFVNSSISTATAVFKGTFNVVADLELNYNASQAQIALMLGSKIVSANNNDYCFVQIPTSNETPLEIASTDRYKFNGTAWAYEYTLNNSGFTAAQWAAINSGITSLLKDKLIDLPTATELATQLEAKQNTLTFDTTPTEGSTNPVTSDGINAAIDTEKARALAVEQGLQDDYDTLYALYQTLEGGSIIPVAAADWPVSNPQQNVIYRVANSATPTAYSDYMYNGTITLLMATFSFPGIDSEPTPDSTNLVTSGGTFDAIMQNGPAFDLSAYNAVGGTLATYADLSAALTALNALPAAYKNGGMSMKFVQSSDNKYVQYRLAASIWSTDIHDWTSEDPYFIDKIMQEVNEAIDEHTPIEITGDVTNAPDEEDLTSVNVGGTDVLKFKDKAYNALTYSGLGRKILRKNIVNGVNTLTQDMFYKGEVGSREPNTNTIFIIQYDYTLAEDITIPANCVLQFDGGSLSNGTINGQNTLIENPNFDNITLDGTFRSKEAYYDTVSDMVSSKNHIIGQYVNTLGYYTKNDGGGASYFIRKKVSSDNEDGNFIKFLPNNLVAELLNNDEYYNVKKYGVKYEDEDYLSINATILLNIIKKKVGTYWTPKVLFFPHGRVWVGNIHLSYSEITGSVDNVSPFCIIQGESVEQNRDNYAATTILTQGSFITWTGYGAIEAKNVLISNQVENSNVPNSVCFGVPTNITTDTGEQNIHLEKVRIQKYHYGFRGVADSSSSYVKNIFLQNCVYGIKFGNGCNRFMADDVMIIACAFGLCDLHGQNIVLNNMHLGVGTFDYLANIASDDGNPKLAGIKGGGLEINSLYVEDYAHNGTIGYTRYAVLWLVYKNIGINTSFINDFYLYYRDTGNKQFKFLRCFDDIKAYFTTCRNLNIANIQDSKMMMRRSAFEFYDDAGQEDSKEDAGIWRHGFVFSEDTDISALRQVFCKAGEDATVLLKDKRAGMFCFTATSIVNGFVQSGENVINWTPSDYYNEMSNYLLGGVASLNDVGYNATIKNPTNTLPVASIYIESGAIPSGLKGESYRYPAFVKYFVKLKFYSEESVTASDYIGKYFRIMTTPNLVFTIGEEDFVDGKLNKTVMFDLLGYATGIRLRVPTTMTNTMLSKLKIDVVGYPERSKSYISGSTSID